MKLRAATLTSLLLIFLTGLYSLWVYPYLPPQIPTHWNLRGEIDGWMPKGAAILFLLGVMGAMLALMLGAQRLSPRRFDIAAFRNTFNYLMVLVIGLFGFIGFVMLQAALHPDMDSGRLIIGGVMLFFTLMSNSMGKVRRNFWMGVRTPWTMASETVWIATHRLAARLWFVTGLFCTLALWLGAPVAPIFGLFMAALFVPIFYSFWLYKRTHPFGS